jgi:hypothetical protein
MNVNLELVDFITKTNNITGCSFASIRNYTNSSGEVANHLINLGATLSGAKAKDLATIKKVSVSTLYTKFFNTNPNINFETFTKAFNELQDSFVKIGDKNLDGTDKEQSNYSAGQTNAYQIINPSVKVHIEKQRLYIYALRESKEILEYGEYKTTKKQAKTICKDFIKKELSFKSEKFVMYIVEKADVMNLAKTTFNGEELTINL